MPSPRGDSRQQEPPGQVSYRRHATLLLLLVLWWLPFLPALWELFFPQLPELLSSPGIGISNSGRTEIAMLALLALALSGWRPGRLSLRSPALWTAAFLCWSALCALAGADPVESLFFMAGWLAAACVVPAARTVVTPKPSLPQRLAIVHLPLILMGIFSIAPMFHTAGEFRAAGPFQLPGVLSNWLLMLIPLALDTLYRARGRELPLALASSTMAIVTIGLTVSRAAWLVAMMELTLLLLLEARRPVRTLLGWSVFAAAGLLALVLARSALPPLGLFFGVAALCAIPVLVTALRGQLSRTTLVRTLLMLALAAACVGMLAKARPEDALSSAAQRRLASLTSANDDSAAGRVQLWKAGLALSLQHPLLGVAPGRFGETYPQVQQYYYYFSDSVHGAMLEMMAEVGWPGAGLFLLALLAILASRPPDPWDRPWQRAPLVGLLMGAVYAQVEVSYHFAILWTSAAFLLAAATARPDPQRCPEPEGRWIWALPLVAALGFLLPLQRQYEEAVRQIRPADAYREARQVSDRLPCWSEPALSALQYGLGARLPPEQLRPLVDRVLRYATGDAAAYQLAGEVALREKDYARARQLYTRSLQLDPFNHPGNYHGLLLIASATGDKELSQSVLQSVLATYDLDRWEVTHLGHRAALARELRPLLFDLADAMSPYRQPRATEPLYRFLLRTGGEARALYGLGVSLWTQGQLEEARPLLQRAHRIDPAYPPPP
jgi:tetratricopeptide (TPR) repeat protein